MRNFAAVFAAVVMFAFPGVALGQGSGSDAYEENIPGGGGNTPSNNDNGGNEGGSPLPEATQGALEEQGADGEAAANLAQETGPSGSGSGNSAGSGNSTGSGSGNGNGSDSGSAVNLTPADGEAGPGGSGIDEVVGELAGGSDDGMGVLLPIILGSVLVAGVAFVIIRRSSGGSAGSA